MCLRLVYVLVVGVLSWLWLAGRQDAWKDAEVLLLRHQVGVLRRQQVRRSRLMWVDRVLIAALAGVIPKARRVGLRLLVTPGDGGSLAPGPARPPLGCQVRSRPLWSAW
jgi:hypothetical protein